MRRVEVCATVVAAAEMALLKRSWWFSWDRQYLNGDGSVDCGCLGRLVICGYGFEVFRTI